GGSGGHGCLSAFLFYLPPSALYLNFWPATVASYIAPPLTMVNTAMPFLYAPAVAASFLPPLAPALVPLLPALAEAADVIATAPTSAPKAKSPEVNSLNARSSSKKTIWL